MKTITDTAQNLADAIGIDGYDTQQEMIDSLIEYFQFYRYPFWHWTKDGQHFFRVIKEPQAA